MYKKTLVLYIIIGQLWVIYSQVPKALRSSSREDWDSLVFQSLQTFQKECAKKHLNYLKEFEKFRTGFSSPDNEYILELLDYHYLSRTMEKENNSREAQKTHRPALDKLKASRFPEIQVYALIIEANHFLPDDSLGQRQELMLKAYNTGIKFRLQGSTAYNTASMALVNLYMKFEDYTTAIHYLLAQNSSHFNDLYNKIQCLNSLAMCYTWTNEPDKALPYLYTLVTLTEKFNLNDWNAISHGNIGRIFLDKEMYNEAIPHLYKDFTVSCSEYNWDCGLLSGIRLMKIYNETGHWEKAGEIFAKLSQTASNGNLKTKIEYYQTAAEYFQKTGNVMRSNAYFDSAIQTRIAFQKKRDTEQLALHKNKIQAEKYLAELDMAHENIALKNNIRNILIVVLVLLITTSVIILLSLKVSIRRKREIYELELQLANLEKHNLESENINMKSRLNQVIQDLREKSLKIEKYEASIVNKKDAKYTETLTKMHLSTDENWYKFKQQFKTIHPTFIQEISEELPKITAGEIRYLCLLKLSLESFEIANLLGVNKESVQKIKQRIKNKIASENAIQIAKLLG